MFQDLEDANMIYLAILLSVGREARGKGLGTELMRRGYEIAKQVSYDLWIHSITGFFIVTV